jgi:hypothetical protein
VLVRACSPTILHSNIFNVNNKFTRFLVYSNTWISLGGVLFALQFYVLFKLPINPYYLGFIGCSTFMTYNFQRFVKLRHDAYKKNERFQWMIAHHKLLFAMMSIAGIGLLYTLFKLDFFDTNSLHKSSYILVLMAFLSFFYIVRLPVFLSSNLRDIPYIKIYLIAIVWMLSASYLPAIFEHYPFNQHLHLFALACLIFILGLTIPFDIRDLAIDQARKKTIPQLIGVRKSLILSSILLAIATLLFVYIQQEILWFTIASSILIIILLLRTKTSTKEFYFSFVIDGFLIGFPLAMFVDFIL